MPWIANLSALSISLRDSLVSDSRPRMLAARALAPFGLLQALSPGRSVVELCPHCKYPTVATVIKMSAPIPAKAERVIRCRLCRAFLARF